VARASADPLYFLVNGEKTMPRASSWLWAGAGLALLLGLAAPARAWDLFHRCRGDCGSQTVNLPGQQIVVERTAPRVIVQDTRPLRVTNFAAPPVVASFFVPMPLSLGTVGVQPPGGVEDRESVTLDFAGLQAAHDLERSQARALALQAIHEAQAKHVQAAMERVAAIARESASPKSTPSAKCCDDLNQQLKNLVNRVEQLEQLVDKHDKAIRKDPAIKIPDPK
jgi:hypothetical protein